MADIKELIGKTFASVEPRNADRLVMVTDDGKFYVFHHSQDCCESVTIDDIAGDLSDLVGTPILEAEEVSGGTELTPDGYRHEYEPDSLTWTFYKFATIRGRVTVRWLGESNGYYSESVDLIGPDDRYYDGTLLDPSRYA